MTKRREPYAKVFASWWRHPRTGALSLPASGLEARLWSWSCDAGTDGRIPNGLVAQAAGPAAGRHLAAALSELLRAGVLTEDADAYIVRDFLDANISREADEARRENAVTRQDRSRGVPVTRDRGVTAREIAKPVTRDRSVSHTPSLDHDHDHDHEKEISSARGSPDLVAPARPAATPPDSLPLARVLRGFQSRWEAKRVDGAALGPGWPGVGKHSAAADRVAAAYADKPADLAASLDGYFASADPFVAKVRWNFATWAQDPGRYASARTDPPVSDAVMSDLKRQIAEFAASAAEDDGDIEAAARDERRARKAARA